MLRTMLLRLISYACLPIAVLWLSSCGSTEGPLLAGDARASASEGDALYQEAKQADDAGKTSRAIKLYDETATRHPFAKSAAQARFRQAHLNCQPFDFLFESELDVLVKPSGEGDIEAPARITHF